MIKILTLFADFTALTFVIVFISRVSGVTTYLKRFAWRYVFRFRSAYDPDWSVKLLDCSLCQTFWVTLIYGCLVYGVHLYVLTLACVMAALAEHVEQLIWCGKDLIGKKINRVLYGDTRINPGTVRQTESVSRDL